jgi:hypothetical protein
MSALEMVLETLLGLVGEVWITITYVNLDEFVFGCHGINKNHIYSWDFNFI